MLPLRLFPRSSGEHCNDAAGAVDGPCDLSAITSSDSPSSASSAGGATNNSDDSSAASLPSLRSLLLPFSSSSTSSSPIRLLHLCLTSLKPLALSASAPALAVAAASRPPLLYSASEGGIVVFDVAALRTVETLPGVPAAGSVKSLALAPDGSAFFTAHQDGRIRVWRRSSRADSHRLAAVLPTSSDRFLRLPLPSNYVTVRRHHRRLWIEHADAVSSLAVSCTGDGASVLYSCSWDRTLKTWRADRGHRCLGSVRAHGDAVNAVAASGDGVVYTGSADGRIRVWATPSPQPEDRAGASCLRPRRRRRRGGLTMMAELEGHRSAVNALALSRDGSVLYSGSGDRTILVWEREESASHMVIAGALRGHSKAVLCLACAGDVVVSGSADRTVRIWRRNATDGRDGARGRGGFSCLGVMEGHVSGVRSVVAAPVATSPPASDSEEEFRVCSGSMDGEVRVWQIRFSGTKQGSDMSCR